MPLGAQVASADGRPEHPDGHRGESEHPRDLRCPNRGLQGQGRIEGGGPRERVAPLRGGVPHVDVGDDRVFGHEESWTPSGYRSTASGAG